MLKQKKEWLWLALVILIIVFLIVSCDFKQVGYQNTNKLLMFDYRYDVSSGWNRTTNPAVIGVRTDGAIRIAESSLSSSYSTYSSTGQETIQSNYHFKDGNLLANELAELKDLITIAEKTKWKDEQCNILSTSLKHIQIKFYDNDKIANTIDVCFLRGDDQTIQYLPPNLPDDLSQLVNKLIEVKESFDALPWYEQEIGYAQIFDWEWWLNNVK